MSSAASDRPRLVYLVSHPIQYQAPLLRRLADRDEVDLRVLFLSDFSTHAYRDAGFGREVRWDVPLLEGYSSRVLSREPSVGPRRPDVKGIGEILDEERPDVLWVHGWRQATVRRALAHARRRAVPVLLRGESKPERRGALRRLYLRRFLGQAAGCLPIGSANRRFYLQHGVPEERLFAAPYGVDHDHFRRGAERASAGRDELRASLGLDGRPILLFAAKLIERKRPLDLLEAFGRLPQVEGRPPAQLLFVGDGPERGALEAAAGDSVHVLGFRNQGELPAFYDLCDAFVLPSRYETWGLSLNEAMCVGRPVVTTEGVGAAEDLVREGETGCSVPVGDVAALARALGFLLADADRRGAMGLAARERVEAFGLERTAAGIEAAARGVRAA